MSRLLADLADSDAFRTALVLGGIAAALGVPLWLVLGARRPAPVGGALFAAAALWGLHRSFELPPGVVIGVAALGVAALVGRRVWDRTVAGLPGAYLVVAMGDLDADVPMVALVIATALAAALATDLGGGGARGIGMPLLALTAAGVLVTVPDTERAMVLVGVAAPLALTGPPLRVLSLGPGAAAAVGVVAWVAGTAWTGRPGATVGALASLGLLLAEPVGRRLSGNGTTAMRALMGGGALGAPMIVAIHAALVVGGSRIAGLVGDALVATLIAVAVLAVGAVLAAAPAPPRSGNRERLPTDP